jgi:hypothetical protein
MSAAGARRSARFDAHLLPRGDRVALDVWRAERAAAGRADSPRRVGIIRGVFLQVVANRARCDEAIY